jgi:hypothetical protein
MYYEIPQPPPPENIGKDIWKVLLLQLSIFVAYQAGLALLCKMSGFSGFMIVDILPLVCHWIVLIVLAAISFARKKPGRGIGYIISLVITGIVGFGSCFYLSGVVNPHFNI